jgi:hypothetical protein
MDGHAVRGSFRFQDRRTISVMHVLRAALVAGLVGAAGGMTGGLALDTPGSAQPPAQTQGRQTGAPPAQPGSPAPGAPAPQAPGAQTPGAADPAAPVPPPAPRTFTGPTGLLFNSVRPERAVDFEKFLAYLRAALDKTTDPTVQEQAKGWRVFRDTVPGPNSTVTFIFVIDPTVPDADYSMGPILAEAYPDVAQLTEIWKLYTSSVTNGGSLMNLNPVVPVPPPPLLTPPLGTTAPAPAPTPVTPPPPLPPDADPVRRP